MEKLDDLLHDWITNKDIEKILESSVFQNSEIIQSELDSFDPETRKKYSDILLDITAALKCFIAETTQEKDNISEQIEALKKNAEACIRYGQTSTLDKKGNS